MRATRSRKKGFLCVLAAAALTLGLALPGVMKAWAEGEEESRPHTITLDSNCDARKADDGTYKITCTIEELDDAVYEIHFGYLGEDGGFRDFEPSDFKGYSIDTNEQGKKVVVIDDDEMFDDGYIHLLEPECVEDEDNKCPYIVGMVEGKEENLDGGNLALKLIDGKNFGLALHHENDPEGEGGDGPTHVYWDYGPDDTYGGSIALVAYCEPAWAYDENAAEGTYMDCVDVDGDYQVEGKPVEARQDSNGGDIHSAHGVKLKFEVTPDEDYELVGMDFITEPEEIELDVSAAGDVDGGTFEFDMPMNISVRVVAYFNFASEDAIEIWQEGEEDEECGAKLPRILKAEAKDAPEGVALRIRCPLSEEDGDDAENIFTEDVYGDADEFWDYVFGLMDDETPEEEMIGLVMNKYGKIMAINFEMGLVDIETGEKVDYDGDGVEITFAMSDWLSYFGEALADGYDGDMEISFAHIKADGTVEYIPVTQNDDGTFTVTVKNMSPFALTASAVKASDNPSTDDDVNLYIVVGMAGMVLIAAVVYVTRKTVRK